MSRKRKLDKKLLAILLSVGMCSSALPNVYAQDNTKQSVNTQTPPEKPDGEAPAGNPPEMPNDEAPAGNPPEMPNGEAPTGNPPEMPNGEASAGNPPEMPNGGENSTDSQEVKLPFSDVADNAWYYSAISKVYSKGIISGVSATSFSPTSSVTGAELIALLYRTENNGTEDNKNSSSGNWYDSAIRWAEENNILTDDLGWDFQPTASLTREQMMVILYNYLSYKGEITEKSGDISSFKDSTQVAEYA